MKYWLLILITALNLPLFGQTEDTENSVLNRFNVGLHMGTGHYMGDLRNELFFYGDIHPSYGGHVSFDLNKYFEIHGLFLGTKLDANTYTDLGYGRDFTSSVFTPQVFLRLKFNDGFNMAANSPFRMYFQSGLSYQYSSVVYNKVKKDPLKNEINQTSKIQSLNVPFGLVFGYRFQEYWEVDLNLNAFWSFSDQLDGYFSGERTDVVLLPTISIQYNLAGFATGKKKATELDEPEEEEKPEVEEAMPLKNDGDPEFLDSTDTEETPSPSLDTTSIDTTVDVAPTAPDTVATDSVKKEPVNDPFNYRVQLGAFSKSVNELHYKDVPQLKVLNINGVYKVYSGDFEHKEEALEHRLKMIEMGYTGAFVVKFQNGEPK